MDDDYKVLKFNVFEENPSSYSKTLYRVFQRHQKQYDEIKLVLLVNKIQLI